MVEMGKKSLSTEDVKQLLENPSGEIRAHTAEKIASDFNGNSFSGEEKHIAEEIFRLMVRDAEVRVREALAVNLKENVNLPRDVAKSLAKDVDSVALPVIQFSEVLTTKDLIEIVETQGESKQNAVASRPFVEKEVSDVIVEKAGENVVATLVSNEGAQISEESFNKVVDKYGDKEMIQKPLVYRSKVPISVAEKLVNRVSEELQSHLVTHHELPADVATDLVLQTRERATVGLSQNSSEEDVKELVMQLKKNNRLTPSIVLRSICMGDLKFFEYALALLANIPVKNARILIHDAGGLGFKKLYEKAGQPVETFPAAKEAISVMNEMEIDFAADNAQEKYRKIMIERILTRYDKLGVEFESDDLEYLLAKMSSDEVKKTAETYS